MENRKSRKEWVKNFAIIFLAVLLVLTFFSNTIRNYSLPEVAAQYCYSGEIVNKVRGQGTVETDAPYEVVYKQSRKIESVAVRVGDIVEKGDVLYVLEEGESSELKEAESALKKLEAEYEKAIIEGQVSLNITGSIENSSTGTLSEKQSKIDDYNKKITAYENEISGYDKQIEIYKKGDANSCVERKNLIELTQALSDWTQQKTVTAPRVTARKEEYDDAVAKFNAAYGDVTANDVSGNADYISLKSKMDEAEEAYNKAKAEDNTAAEKKALYTINVDDAQKILDDKVADLEYKKALAEANRDQVKDALSKYVGDVTTTLDISEKLKAIEDQKKTVEKLKSEQGTAEITTPVSGTILSMTRVAGETIEQGETVATLQVAGKGFTITMPVTNEQAMLISMGDEAEVVNSWWYTDVHARVKSIRPDPSNPSKGKLVIFEVEGDVTNGQTLSLTVGNRYASYDNIVPNSAIREDNDGSFIYRVASKSTPLGTRYSAERVNVKVLASDETSSAISGALEGWEYVITTSSKPIEDGDLIRLKD